jgi:hypothetical protein
MRSRATPRALLVAFALALVLVAAPASTAFAQQGTITAQACAQGRVRDSSGQPISRARCEQLIGQPVTLAATGLDVWLLALAGVACITGAVLLRRRSATG